MKNIFRNRYIQYTLLVLGGLFLGWLFFHSPETKEEKHDHAKETAASTVWTCSMHPQIRMDKAGKCPLCAMDLIPVNKSDAVIDPAAVHFTKEAAELANVATSVVTRQKPEKEVRLYGKIQQDERLLQSLVAHIPGRIEKLMINFTGETVRQGQTLALIFSPELITAQQEFFEAIKTRESQPEIYEAVKEKLRLWKLSESQISAIESSGKIKTNFEVISNSAGIVISRRVNSGDYVSQGTVLFEIADLSKVWAMFDAYESDLPFLSEGNKLSFTVQAIPGQTFTGKVTFIDPVIDPATRVSKVRVEIDNRTGKLKPEMFATGIVNANLAQYRNNFIIPRSAVLWTGKRSIVYVRVPGSSDPVFRIRQIEIGPALGNSYVVLNGLTEGEEIVTQGAFSVDAAAQLEGKPSMMNSEGGEAISGHNHGDMGNTASKPVEVSVSFKKQLNEVFDNYTLMKDAFVKSNAAEVKKTAAKVHQSLSKIDMKLVPEKEHARWMDLAGKLDNEISKIEKAPNLEQQRLAFSNFNTYFYQTVKTFGLSGKTVYYQFCPMANNDKGAYWLSKTEPILNPYFGDEMLTCGEVKETIKF